MGLSTVNIVSDAAHYGDFICGECGDLAPFTTAVETPCCSRVYCETCLESYAAKMAKTCGEDRSEGASFWQRWSSRDQPAKDG